MFREAPRRHRDGVGVGCEISDTMIGQDQRARRCPLTNTAGSADKLSCRRHATQVRALGERLQAEGALTSVPSLFEQVTMLAYLFFSFRRVDLAVLEVGLGGRLDATNVCEPLATAITPIDFDHQRHLGDTLAEIAGERTRT